MSYKVYAEHYYNDLRTTDHVLHFDFLDIDFIEWVDAHSSGHGNGIVSWGISKWDGQEYINRIDLGHMSDGGCWWIHEIDSKRGIEFTDGTRTGGKTHVSKRVRSVIESYHDRISNPEAIFVD